MAPPGELRVKAGVVLWQVTLCDPHLSALEVRFSRRCAIQIDVYLTFTAMKEVGRVCKVQQTTRHIIGLSYILDVHCRQVYGVFAVQQLCDPYLSASEASFSQYGAIQIYLPLKSGGVH